MADNTEIDDRVDLDDDNYIEEDDDVEEQIEEEASTEAGEDNGEDQHEETTQGDSGKEQLLEPNRSDIDIELVEKEQDSKAPSYSGDISEHAELLALPAHGSEVFIGGLPRDISEEDLRDLCDSIGEIFEVC